jgi:hypothetical protein
LKEVKIERKIVSTGHTGCIKNPPNWKFQPTKLSLFIGPTREEAARNSAPAVELTGDRYGGIGIATAVHNQGNLEALLTFQKCITYVSTWHSGCLI